MRVFFLKFLDCRIVKIAIKKHFLHEGKMMSDKGALVETLSNKIECVIHACKCLNTLKVCSDIMA